MEMAIKNLVRAQYIKTILDHLSATEDVALIASNTLNFPISYNGEEGWVEVTVKIPKEEGDDGYLKRESYKMHLEEKREKAKAQEEAKAKKIAADKAKRKKKDNEQKGGE